MKQLTALTLLLTLVPACKGSDLQQDGTSGISDERPSLELLPTPFTADQIRNGCLPGSQFVFRIDEQGQPRAHQIMRFLESEGDIALVESWMESPAGEARGSREQVSVPWSELRDHALLPLGSTRERATITVEQGTHEGWHYVQPFDDERGQGFRNFWFADRFPGPPVLLTEVIAGEEVSRCELIARAMP